MFVTRTSSVTLIVYTDSIDVLLDKSLQHIKKGVNPIVKTLRVILFLCPLTLLLHFLYSITILYLLLVISNYYNVLLSTTTT